MAHETSFPSLHGIVSAIPTYEGNFLLMGQGMTVVRVPFDAASAKPGQPVLVHPKQMATGIDIDCIR